MKIKLFLLVSVVMFSCGRGSNVTSLGKHEGEISPKTEVVRESKSTNDNTASNRYAGVSNKPVTVALQGTNGDSELWGQ